MVTSIMKKRTIRERKKNRRQTIAVWITTCIATALFAAVFSFASSCQAGLIEYAKDLSRILHRQVRISGVFCCFLS